MSQEPPNDRAQDVPGEDPNAPIPLEPLEPEPPRRPSGKARIDAPGLTDDFDEDADFESDPELERVVRGIPVGQKEPPPARREEKKDEESGEAICASASWRVPAGVGALVTLTAAVFAGVYADATIWAHVLRTIYWGVLHTATGVGAVVVTAVLLGRPVGKYEGIAARMLVAVSLFLVVFSLQIPIPTRIDETVLAAAAYFGAVVVLFRLTARDAGVLVGAHFGLALLVTMGNMLSAVIARGAAG